MTRRWRIALEFTQKNYTPKTILNTHKRIDGGWFWTKYSALPYLGCAWGCEYCFCRDEKYNPHKTKDTSEFAGQKDPFSQTIKVKQNAVALLDRALVRKTPDVIRIGDYQPLESRVGHSRELLKLCFKHRFPTLVVEKSPLLNRDLDILSDFSNGGYVNVGWSIIAAKDSTMRRSIERHAPPSAARFKAMEKMALAGIRTGTIFMPMLPYVFDSKENIEAIVQTTRDRGGSYVLDGGLSLFGNTRRHFFQYLTSLDPKLSQKYQKLFNHPNGLRERGYQAHQRVVEACEKYGIKRFIERPLAHFPKTLRDTKWIAGKLFLGARELWISGRDSKREWAYRKTAWQLEELQSDIGYFLEQAGTGQMCRQLNISEEMARLIRRLWEKRVKERENSSRASPGKNSHLAMGNADLT